MANNLFTRFPIPNFEVPLIVKDGREVWIGQHVQLVIKEDQVVGFQAMARDMTKQKQAEAALRESEEKYRSILEAIEKWFL